jgi:hypothetical protein
MATIKRIFATLQTIMNAVSVTTGSASTAVDLETDGYEGAHVTVDADFPASPTDNLIVEVQASLDGTNWDDTPLMKLEIDNGTDPNQISFIVRDVAQFRLYCYRSGSTDTITVTAKCQRWRWDST